MSTSHLGQISSNRKLILDIANEIRKEYETGSVFQKQLGIKYGLSQNSIFNIVNNKTYKK